MNDTKKLTHARVLQLLTYEPDTGEFRWRITDRCRTAGEVAGCKKTSDGYTRIGIDGRLYLASRLAWFYVNGRWPEAQIDHENLRRGDNRWKNLRDATNKQNNENRILQKNSRSGVMGVSWFEPRKKWQVGIKHHGVRKNLGYFGSLLDAVATRLRAERALFTHSPRL